MDHVQREKFEPLANSRNAAMATHRREHLPRISTKSAKSAQGVLDGHLLSEGRMDDGVRQERGERAETRRHHKVLGGTQEDQVRLERDVARHAHVVQEGRWHLVRR